MLRKMVEFVGKMALLGLVLGMFLAAGAWAVGDLSLLELAGCIGVLWLASSRLFELLFAPAEPRRRAPVRRPAVATAARAAAAHRRPAA